MKYIALILAMLIPSTHIHASVITVTFRGMEHPNGVIRIAIYNSKDGFPGKGKPIRRESISIKSDLSAYSDFDKLPEGNYAISAYHDTNNNNKLDTNFIGIPKEPVFISNNAKGKMGPPTFEQASFYLGKGTQTLLLHAQ